MESAAYRDQIYEIFANPNTEFETQIRQALTTGTEYLDLSVGFFTRIVDGTQEILHATGDHPLIQPGESCPLDEAYCRRTIKLDSQLAIEDARASPEIADTAIETFDLGAYIGAKVIVDGEVYGTACFADPEPRDDPFVDAERFFVELVARLGGQAIERHRYERELTQREERLNEQREIYRAVIDASFDSVFRLDTDGVFTYASDGVRDLLGYSPAELIGQPITIAHPDTQTSEWAMKNRSQILNGELAEARDLPLKTKSGDIVYTDIRGVPVYDGSVPKPERSTDDIVGILILIRDATERRQREGLISVINRVLRHNVRNEMSVIHGWADMLAEDMDEEQATKATVIRAAATRLLDLTESAQRIEENRDISPELEPTDIIPLLNRTVTECKTRYSDVSITVDAPDKAIAETLPRIEVALFELVDNAAKHGGSPASIEIDVAVSDRQVICRIRDDGPGLPNTERGVIETGEETPLVHGQGLGLWLCYWIITTLDGEIEVTEFNQGTTIEVHLPTPP
ncbi:ATP-binding protein [Haloarcula laminariae]|uniref:ATP-binding protein n=1 Tax=Haloarcula laminariae TaxID=2961577 RepID=UPI0021C5EAAD|nr:ATP-binding protein [Halomicroarcula laminariae]